MRGFTKTSKYYWYCQFGGWGVYGLISLFFALNLATSAIGRDYYLRLSVYLILGLVITHLMREVILRFAVIRSSIDRQVIYFAILSVVFGFLYGLMSTSLFQWMNLNTSDDRKYSFFQRLTVAWFGGVFIILFWNVVYFIYHYNRKIRFQELNTLRLQNMVKELELKTIKAHINPHFIFNALNSIRALVDENPQRARTAITQLSNILRSSLQTDKLETVSLETELNIVKDYLELETIRFEDRLSVTYAIEEDTLDQPVPPMMIQTLVENAIKHGISKQMSGGVIHIQSDFINQEHVIIISNTGKLNGQYNEYGFGLESTRSRLQLMYGTRARFSIQNTNENVVKASITLPVN